jgi:hypothetical protein
VRGQMSSSRGSQRMYPDVGGRQFKPCVWVRRTSPDSGGAGSGELEALHPSLVYLIRALRPPAMNTELLILFASAPTDPLQVRSRAVDNSAQAWSRSSPVPQHEAAPSHAKLTQLIAPPEADPICSGQGRSDRNQEHVAPGWPALSLVPADHGYAKTMT